MDDELIAFARQMDRCWMESRFDDLSAYIADDVVMIAPGGAHRAEGLTAAVESYRDFMSRSSVARFHADDYVVTERGATAVVEYGWDMAWADQGADHEAKGREILILTRTDDGWRVIWRMQLEA
ncbi:YybH family protein [Sphingomonas sp.]|uniref:YybH family protein n=1 Tax=Sphingomonas sp. TaxID=28214 RepID=UPI0035C7950F